MTKDIHNIDFDNHGKYAQIMQIYLLHQAILKIAKS